MATIRRYVPIGWFPQTNKRSLLLHNYCNNTSDFGKTYVFFPVFLRPGDTGFFHQKNAPKLTVLPSFYKLPALHQLHQQVLILRLGVPKKTDFSEEGLLVFGGKKHVQRSGSLFLFTSWCTSLKQIFFDIAVHYLFRNHMNEWHSKDFCFKVECLRIRRCRFCSFDIDSTPNSLDMDHVQSGS